MLKSKQPITVREETIEDAILATQLLKQDSRIDPQRVFIVGHSMGGMLAPRIDAEGGNYRGLILMAGTPRTLEEVMVGQMEDIMAGRKGLMNLILGKQLQKISRSFVGMYDLSDEAAKAKKMGNGTTLYYFKEMGEHPAADYLQNLEKPLLIMQGEKDVQVKVDRDFALYQQLLQDKPNAVFKLYDNLNHAFVPAIYDNILKANQEFAKERHISEDVIADIANWIKSASA